MQTSRPSVISPSTESPYAPDFASNIAQSLCRQENIQHVIFVGQADGSAIAVLAAASSRRSVLFALSALLFPCDFRSVLNF